MNMITFKINRSRARSTKGIKITTMMVDDARKGQITGQGFDVMGELLGNFAQETFQARLIEYAKNNQLVFTRIKEIDDKRQVSFVPICVFFPGVRVIIDETNEVKSVELRGDRGFDAMCGILEKIGITLTMAVNCSKETSFFIEDASMTQC